MFLVFLLLCFASLLNNAENQTVPGNETAGNETGSGNETVPDTNFPHPTTAGVVVTMILGLAIIFTTVMPMCCMKQPDDYLYDPSKPLLQSSEVPVS